jgi:hypothetical protein
MTAQHTVILTIVYFLHLKIPFSKVIVKICVINFES